MKQMKQIVARCTCDGTAKQKNSLIMCNLLTKTCYPLRSATLHSSPLKGDSSL